MFKVQVSKTKFMAQCDIVAAVCKNGLAISNESQFELDEMAAKLSKASLLFSFGEPNLKDFKDILNFEREEFRWETLKRVLLLKGLAQLSDLDTVEVDEEVYKLLFDGTDKYLPLPK